MAQDNKFLEEITSLFTKTTKASGLIIDKVSRIALPEVHEDIWTIHSRGSLIRLLILLKLMAIPNIHKLKVLDVDRLLPFGKDVLYKPEFDIRNYKNSASCVLEFGSSSNFIFGFLS